MTTRTRKVATLPDDLYCELVDNLFGTFGAWVAAVAGSLTMASAGVVLDGRLRFTVCLAILAVLSLVRGMVLVAYRRSSHRKDDAAAMRRWEIAYSVPAILWMAAIGLDSYLAMSAPDMMLRIFASVMAIGVAGGVAGRNASRPWIVVAQVAGVLIPYSVALLQIGSVPFLALLGMTVFTFMGVRSTSQSFYDLLVAAMTAARRNTVLANRFDTALNNMSHGLIMFNHAQAVEVVNERFLQLFGIAAGAIGHGSTLGEVIEAGTRHRPNARRTPAEYETLFRQLLTSGSRQSMPLEMADGRSFDIRFEPMRTGGAVVVVEDVTEHRKAAARIEKMAHYDELTDLPNRALLLEILAERCGRLIRGECPPFSLLYLDLDHFKQINDTLGHSAGDALLTVVSRRIKRVLRAGDVCARLAGDEFVVIVSDIEPENVAGLASRLILAVSAPYTIDQQEVLIGLTIGIARTAEPDAGAETLLKRADLALYRGKTQGRGTFCFFEDDMIREADERRSLEIDLRHALENDDLDVYFQPIFDVPRGQVSAYEALVRWRHPTRGIVHPDSFIKLAEATGLIVDLGAVVLRKACLAARSWPEPIAVAVNLSAVQFRRGVVFDQIEHALAATGLPAKRLEIEITESAVLSNLPTTRATLEKIRALGVRVGLDDFGTGFSSLAYLHQIPFDKIKIDKSFVRDLTHDGMSRALIRLMASFGRTLDKVIVVEGVESAEQAQVLGELGVGQMQGYHFGRPQPADRLVKLYRAADRRRAKLSDVA